MITVNKTKLDEIWSDREYEFDDIDEVNSFVQTVLDEHVIVLPGNAQAVAYYINDDDPGYIFSIRPRPSVYAKVNEFSSAQVAGFFTEARDIEPRDEFGCLRIDGGVMTNWEAAQQLAQNVVDQLEPLMPAYEKLWGSK